MAAGATFTEERTPSVVRRSRAAGKVNGQLVTPDVGQAEESRLVPIWDVKPSPENDLLYRPVSPSDPDVVALAESIGRIGLREPLVITEDYYILSGHRRYAACMLAGIDMVPCRVEPIRRGDGDEPEDPRFVELLREFNRQRVKTFDEVAREEAVSVNPEEAHRCLQEHRRQAAAVDVETIQIDAAKPRAEITGAKRPLLDAILEILEEQRDYWPLTDRRVHYALLNKPPLVHASKAGSRYANTVQCYKACCELITRARLTGDIAFKAIHDPTRPVTTWKVDAHAGAFARRSLDGFLKGYSRDLQQSQPNHIEIVGEKNTVESILRPVAMEFCIPLTIGRGYCSLPPRHAMAQRYRRRGKNKLILLVLSDFDPEGEDIAHSFARSMRDDFDVKDVVPVKVALTRDQVEEMGLPPQMKAKAGSSRRAKFVERHGDDVFELEAVPPERLQAILRDAIDSVLDIDAYNRELDAEEEDAARLEGLRRAVLKQIGPALEADGV
jgi:hypothetical protein